MGKKVFLCLFVFFILSIPYDVCIEFWEMPGNWLTLWSVMKNALGSAHPRMESSIIIILFLNFYVCI